MKEPKERNADSQNAFKTEEIQPNASRANGGADSVAGIGGISDLIERVISAGGYLSFGRTSDGGATLIRVLHGNKRMTAYASSRAEFLEKIHALQLMYPERKGNVVQMPTMRPETAQEG